MADTETKERVKETKFLAHAPDEEGNSIDNWVIIINYGTDLTNSLTNKVFHMGANVLLLDFTDATDELLLTILQRFNIKGIFLSGSSVNYVNNPESPQISPVILQSDKPILSICYGTQSLAKICGVEIGPNDSGTREEWVTKLGVIDNSVLWKGLNTDEIFVHMYHKYEPKAIPPGFVQTATTKGCIYAAFEMGNIYCLMFHPEFKPSLAGNFIIRNFLMFVCKVPTFYY